MMSKWSVSYFDDFLKIKFVPDRSEMSKTINFS